jgi:hypothetical protein
VVIVGKRARDLVSPDEREDEMNVALGGIEARGDAGTLPAADADADADGEVDGASDTPAAEPTVQAP